MPTTEQCRACHCQKTKHTALITNRNVLLTQLAARKLASTRKPSHLARDLRLCTIAQGGCAKLGLVLSDNPQYQRVVHMPIWRQNCQCSELALSKLTIVCLMGAGDVGVGFREGVGTQLDCYQITCSTICRFSPHPTPPKHTARASRTTSP